MLWLGSKYCISKTANTSRPIKTLAQSTCWKNITFTWTWIHTWTQIWNHRKVDLLRIINRRLDSKPCNHHLTNLKGQKFARKTAANATFMIYSIVQKKVLSMLTFQEFTLIMIECILTYWLVPTESEMILSWKKNKWNYVTMFRRGNNINENHLRNELCFLSLIVG